jgi:hypothetical protein
LRIAFDCFNKWGRLGPAAESVYKTLQRGRASLFSLQAATKQITAKAHGTMLANGHKGTKQASVLACRSRSERIMRARTTKPKFLAQVTEPQVLVNALQELAAQDAERELVV